MAKASARRSISLLTVAEAAQFVGCCEETIRRAYLSRQLQVLRFGARRVRIRPSALVGWLSEAKLLEFRSAHHRDQRVTEMNATN